MNEPTIKFILLFSHKEIIRGCNFLEADTISS